MPGPPLPPALAAARRRSRLVYGAVVGVLAVALAVLVGVVIGTGEAAHASLRTSAAAPALPSGAVPAAPTAAWRTTDRAAGGDPLWVGTVVTWSQHRLAGRDATTGAVRWSYTRTDLSICDAAQQGGRAYVLFRRDGNCDELSTFDASTGARGWFRTLSDAGEGRLAFGAAGLVVAYAKTFHAVTTDRGIDRYPPVAVTGSGCTYTGLVASNPGVLVTETCADGDHLALWSNSGSGDPSASTRLWRVDVGAGTVAVAANDAVAYAYQAATGTVGRWSVADGSDLGAQPLTPSAVGAAGTALVVGDDVLVRFGDRLFDLAAGDGSGWSTTAAGDPTLAADAAAGGDAQVLIPTSAGAVLADAADGAVVATYSFDPAGAHPRAYDAGAGLLTVTDAGLAYLR